MPVFEYVCRSCAHEFEELVFGRETPACPSCGSTELRKVLSVVNVGSSSAGSSGRDAPGQCAGCEHATGRGGCAIGRL